MAPPAPAALEQTCRSAISIKLAASEFKQIWETFHIALRNLTPLIRNEINLFTILIIKLFIRMKKDTFDLQGSVKIAPQKIAS